MFTRWSGVRREKDDLLFETVVPPHGGDETCFRKSLSCWSAKAAHVMQNTLSIKVHPTVIFLQKTVVLRLDTEKFQSQTLLHILTFKVCS